MARLKLKHLKDLKIRSGTIEILKISTHIHVPKLTDDRKALDKGKSKHDTFIIQGGCEYVKEYLEQRIREGENLTPESPVIARVREQSRLGPIEYQEAESEDLAPGTINNHAKGAKYGHLRATNICVPEYFLHFFWSLYSRIPFPLIYFLGSSYIQL